MITEERIAALEAEVARINAQLRGDRYGVTGRTNSQAIENFLASHTPNELDEAVWRSIEAEREREREEVRRQLSEEVNSAPDAHLQKPAKGRNKPQEPWVKPRMKTVGNR